MALRILLDNSSQRSQACQRLKLLPKIPIASCRNSELRSRLMNNKRQARRRRKLPLNGMRSSVSAAWETAENKNFLPVISLFSGSGGMDTGFEMAGFTPIFALD